MPFLNVIAARGGIPAFACPIVVEELSPGGVRTFERVRPEIVALRLDQVCCRIAGPQPVEIAQCSAHAGQRDAAEHAVCHYAAPCGCRFCDLIPEKIIEQQIFQFGILSVSFGDFTEECRADDASFPPDLGDSAVIELPAVSQLCLAQQRKPLCVRDQLGCIKCVANRFVTRFVDTYGRRRKQG